MFQEIVGSVLASSELQQKPIVVAAAAPSRQNPADLGNTPASGPEPLWSFRPPFPPAASLPTTTTTVHPGAHSVRGRHAHQPLFHQIQS